MGNDDTKKLSTFDQIVSCLIDTRHLDDFMNDDHIHIGGLKDKTNTVGRWWTGDDSGRSSPLLGVRHFLFCLYCLGLHFSDFIMERISCSLYCFHLTTSLSHSA